MKTTCYAELNVSESRVDKLQQRAVSFMLVVSGVGLLVRTW